MKVIFLDFDGVVVCLPPPEQRSVGPAAYKARLLTDCNREPVAQLNRLVEATSAGVVVSSTWRLHCTLEQLQGALVRAGFVGEVVDVTPDLVRHIPGSSLYAAKERGHEIRAWLDEHPDVTDYVVLDDEGDRGPIPPERWVLVSMGWFDGGLLAEHAEQAMAILGREA